MQNSNPNGDGLERFGPTREGVASHCTLRATEWSTGAITRSRTRGSVASRRQSAPQNCAIICAVVYHSVHALSGMLRAVRIVIVASSAEAGARRDPGTWQKKPPAG